MMSGAVYRGALTGCANVSLAVARLVFIIQMQTEALG